MPSAVVEPATLLGRLRSALRFFGRGPSLGTFALLAMVVMLASLAASSLVVVQLLRESARHQTLAAAPEMMNLLTGALQASLNVAPPEQLRRIVNDFGRLSDVRACSVELEAAATDGAAPAARFRMAIGNVANERGALRLRSELRGADDRPAGVVEVAFAVDETPVVAAALGTAYGLVAVCSLGAFWLIYRRTDRQMRPIASVEDNLLAYHSGVERSLELLSIQDTASAVSSAWNSLIGSVRSMQEQLDGYRCSQALEGRTAGHSYSSKAILDALPIGVLRVDDEGNVVYANPSAAALLQLRDELADDAALQSRLDSPAVCESILGLRQACAGSGADCCIEHRGRQTMVRLSRLDVAEHSGDLIVMVQDVSQLKDAERQRDEFLTHITHELRTPLTNIRAYTETLSDDFFDDEATRRECYNVIMSETRRLSKLVEDVLSVSQIDAGAARLTRVPLRIDATLRQVAQEMQAHADAKSIELALRIPTKVPMVQGDKPRLHQVWTNLIGNAIKYTPKGGAVRVDVEPADNLLRTRISDTGIGIPSEHQERIFEKFYRVKSSAVEAEEGTGLGLAIAREIVRMHGGTIRVESVPEAGSTFIVELPVVRESGADGKTPASEVADGAHRHS
ncbi:Alkaline phosphatase synthesis sensor protein PhoR [Phycisphaerae bacterium RAS1]|nr:Alkaline phosphatase synthesis sensor protein PhoR [Phycisphaerae bacterium RAS1]